MYVMVRFTILIFLIFVVCLTKSAFTNDSKTRVLVLTDIENEPDDAMSMVRFLTYANELEVEGLVATTSCWQRDQIADWRIKEIVEAYGKVRDNLEKHASGYPSKEALMNLIKRGYPDFGMNAVGDDKDSEGSEWVISVIDRPDPRPVWVTIWGGANCLAQALYKVKKTRSAEDLNKFVKKIRMYTISDQDDSGPWLRETFPELFYIVSPGFEENWGGGYHYATWSGISGDKFHGRFRGPDFSLVSNETLDENVRKNHGPLGAEYPWVEYLMEGDTPSYLGLIPNGLSDPEHPNYGSWGGRYELYTPRKQKWHYQQETRPIWADAVDEVLAPDGFHYTSNHATIWRWREAYQHDFFARMDWCVKPVDEANHPPIAKLSHPNQLKVKSGETVILNAEGSSDPDGDKITYHWIHYREPSSYLGIIEFEDDKKEKVRFEAPKVSKEDTLHFILNVRDTGKPELTRYQRVIVTVEP
jgi:hypothetical protein